jgi:hypothetical protein
MHLKIWYDLIRRDKEKSQESLIFKARSSLYNLSVFWKHCSLTGDIFWKHSSIHSPSLKKFYLHSVPDWYKVVFLSGFPALETLDTYFKDGNFMNEIFGQPSSNSMSLKSTNDNLTWTYLVSSSHDMTLGIVSYFQSMVEVFLHVFPPCESEFIDPILEELRDYSEDISLGSRHSTSKVKFYFIFMVYMIWFYICSLVWY